MKTKLLMLGTVAVTLISFAADNPPSPPKTTPAGASVLKTQKEQVSYIMGRNIGSTWKRQDVEFDLDLLLRGIKESLEGTTPSLFTEAESREIMMAFQKDVRTKQEEKRKVAA